MDLETKLKSDDSCFEKIEKKNNVQKIAHILKKALKKRLVKRHKSLRQANHELLSRIQQLKAKHPYWGYRCIWAYLKYHEKLPVNRKRIFRLMKENHLLVPKNRFLKTPRKAKTQKPGTIIPNRYWDIDMTKVMIPAFGWVYLHL